MDLGLESGIGIDHEIRGKGIQLRKKACKKALKRSVDIWKVQEKVRRPGNLKKSVVRRGRKDLAHGGNIDWPCVQAAVSCWPFTPGDIRTYYPAFKQEPDR